MDTEAIAELLRDTATEVINPRFRQLATGEIEEKVPGDFVTIADREAEQHLARLLAAAEPDALIVGEEGVFLGETSLDVLANAAHAFVIDPIDGTRNFVNGKAEHGIILAELRDGETTRGWIWHPQFDRMYTVERGSGQVLLNGEPVEASRPDRRLLGAASKRSMEGFDGGGRIAPVVRSSGAACFDYPAIVTGELDFMTFVNTHLWDHLAGALMVRETGGVTRRLNGDDYDVTTRGKGLLIAASPEIWDAVAEVWPS